NELIQIQIQNAMRSDNPTDLEELLHRYRIQEPWFLSYYEPCLKANKTNMISWFQDYEKNHHEDQKQSAELARLRVLLTKEVRAEDAKHLPFWLDFEPSIFQEIAQGLEVQSSDFVDTRFSPLTPNIEENLIWLLQENQLDSNATHQTKSVMSWFLVLGSPTLLEVAFPLWKEKKPDAGIQETLMQATFQHDIRSIEYLMPLLQKATLVQWGTMIRSALAEDKIENVMYFIKHVPLTQEWVIQATQDRLLISARDHQYHAFVYLVRFFFHPNVIIDGVPLLLATIAKKNVRAFEWLVAQEETKLHPISFQYTALRVAAHVDFIEAVVYLKEHGVPLDVKGKENHAVFGISKKKSPLSYRYLHSFDPKYGRLKDILEIIGYGLVLIACGVALFFLGKWKGYY
ncbi:MAG: hypothetical protein PHP32_00265, partial [Candidatus Izemoplasmatales bacterium]|nr:hypothetical protein [Candidatus Izemoplasmatales bacterium]